MIVAGAAKLANELSPEFITRDYEILIELPPPSRWGSESLGSRLGIRLRLHGARDEGLRLTEVGSALGVWASYVVLEAARRIRVMHEETVAQARGALTPLQQFEEVFRFGYFPENANDRPPELSVTYGKWLERAERFPLISPSALHTIYLFDEPERHLHPLAQIEARKWIAKS